MTAPRPTTGRLARTCALIALPLLLGAAPAFADSADQDGSDDVATATSAPAATQAANQATVSATAPGLATGLPTTRMASAETFRPAPVPNERIAEPGAAIASSSEDASLQPNVFSLRDRQNDNGALSGTNAEYDHASRVVPAGGMSLSIPMD